MPCTLPLNPGARMGLAYALHLAAESGRARQGLCAGIEQRELDARRPAIEREDAALRHGLAGVIHAAV